MKRDELTDVTYEVVDGLAWVTINRPERYNAFRARTVDELLACLNWAWVDPEVGVVALTGAGDKAFCTGGDLKQKAETGDYGPAESGKFEMVALQRAIREIPKPVIAAVNGLAVGGGHVLHVICDLTVAADSARFGQSGPKVASFEGGFGAGVLARSIGEKRAREFWMLCELHDAASCERWGLVNKVVPSAELRNAVTAMANKLLAMSPSALRYLKHAINQDTDGLPVTMAFDTLDLLKQTPEAREGAKAFSEKRGPDYSPYR